MPKGKIFYGALLMIVLSWEPSLPATSLPISGNEPIARATMSDDQASKKKVEQESPFVCNMLALDAEGRRRHKVVAEQMQKAMKAVEELPDGYAFRFLAEQSTITLVSEFIVRERLCCPFFTFELVAGREDGPLWLRLRGREGVKEFIKAELGIK